MSVLDMSVTVVLLPLHPAKITPTRRPPTREATYSTVVAQKLLVGIKGSTYSVAPKMPEVIDPVKVKDTAPAINLYSLDSTRLGTIVELLTCVTTWAELLTVPAGTLAAFAA